MGNTFANTGCTFYAKLKKWNMEKERGGECVYLYWLIPRTLFSFCFLVFNIDHCRWLTLFLIIRLFLFSQSLIWKISDTVELLLVQWLSAPLVLSVEDKTDGGQILSHVYTGEKKPTKLQGVFKRQIAASSEGECRCTTVFLYPTPGYPNHLTTSWPCTLGTCGQRK